MATNLRTEGLPPESMAPIRILAGLYRSTFVDKMQERFRLMLAGAYAVYVTAIGEGFDPTLRAHLTDVLQDIIARTSELTDFFEEELMGFFQAAMEQFDAQDAAGERIGELRQSGRANLSPRVEDEVEIRDFVARTVRSIETRHGSVILAVTKTYVKLTSQSVEDFRPPWTPSNLFSAFAAVLQQVDVPIHSRVRLVLYKMFSQEVLRYIGDACLAFRDVLPSDLSELNIPNRGSMPFLTTGATAEGSFINGADFDAVTASEAASNFSGMMPAAGLGEGVPCTVSDSSDDPMSSDDYSGKEWLKLHSWDWGAGKLIRVALILIGGLAAVMWGNWWIGEHLAKPGPSPNQIDKKPVETEEKPVVENVTMNPLPESPAVAPVSPVELSAAEHSSELPPPAQAIAEPLGASKTSSEQAMPAPPPKSSGVPSRPQADSRAKRDALRTVKLKSFVWKVDSDRNEMLFNLTIVNTGKSRVGGIEVVCSQYSKALDFLESGKTVLTESIDPGQTRIFRAVPIGFASKRANRANCVIADLDLRSAK